MRIWPFLPVLALMSGCGSTQQPAVQTSPPPEHVAPAPSMPSEWMAPPSPSAPPAPSRPDAWQLISVKDQAVASTGIADYAADSDPTTEWNPKEICTPDKPQWLSVAIAPHGDGPLALVWTGHGLHYLNYEYGIPRTYSVQVSDDSTDGKDGSWRTIEHVQDNLLRTRLTIFNAAKAHWLRLSFESPWGNLMPEPFVREVKVYQASQDGTPDTWVIMGDSVTSVAFDPQKPDLFGQAVNSRHPERWPILISGGTGGDESGNALDRLAVALPTLPKGTVVGLCYGSNDASHGISLDDYRIRMQATIDRIRDAGDIPLLAVVPWSLNGDIDKFAQVDRDLMAANQLPPGPDFYTYFKAHPDELEVDKVHPNDKGIVSMQHMWAEAAEFRYQ